MKINMVDVCLFFFQSVTQAYPEVENPSSLKRSRTKYLPITSLDALPLRYRRLVEVHPSILKSKKYLGCLFIVNYV